LESNIKEMLHKEIDVLPWSAMVRDFAFGRLYVVGKPWNLVEAAAVLKADNARDLKAAMTQGFFKKPDDDQAKEWLLHDPLFQVIVMSPFVLIQAIETHQN